MSAIAAGTGNAPVVGVIRRSRRLRTRKIRTAPAQQACYLSAENYIPTGTADLWRGSKPRAAR